MNLSDLEAVVKANPPKRGENLGQYLERLNREATAVAEREGWDPEEDVEAIFGPREVDQERVIAARRAAGERE